MLSDAAIEQVLGTIPHKTIGLLGDLFLDRYLDIDAALTEPSLETGLDAYQVVGVRSYPGALGTVVNNLVALGVGRVVPIALIGDDGEGFELRQRLKDMRGVAMEALLPWQGRRTPTYTKPMLQKLGEPPRELNRLDIKNRSRTPPEAEQAVLRALTTVWPELDALIVVDQVSEEECGVITSAVHQRLQELAEHDPRRFVLADSRERIRRFRSVCLKPNRHECAEAAGSDAGGWEEGAAILARQSGRAVFATASEEGIALVEPPHFEVERIHSYPVAGPIDPVGAGDSCSAGIVCGVVSGLSLPEAAAFGNLVASITVQQIGATGTATPEQVRQRWVEVRRDR
jgi:bifunctional ADP-heptose synthase (sugar kinase/adenylyltransferase)